MARASVAAGRTPTRSVLTQSDTERPGAADVTSAAFSDVAWILIAGGLVLSLSGWVDILLFYYPAQFGQNEWEFGTIAQTFDALPLPMMATVLLALGVRARGGHRIWPRGLAVLCALVALCLVGLLVIFVLDVPIAWKAMTGVPGPAQAQASPAVVSGIKRGIAKVAAFGVGYVSAYTALAIGLWRAPRAR